MNTKSLRSNNATASPSRTPMASRPLAARAALARTWSRSVDRSSRNIRSVFMSLARWLFGCFSPSVPERHRDDAAGTNPVPAIEGHDLRRPPWRPDRRTDVDLDAGKEHRHLQVGYRGRLFQQVFARQIIAAAADHLHQHLSPYVTEQTGRILGVFPGR